jgi:hypothetical protein
MESWHTWSVHAPQKVVGLDGKTLTSLGYIKPYMACISWWGDSESEAIDEKLA